MNLYTFLEDNYKLEIIKNTSKTNKTIKIITNSDCFEELFLTKKEKENNNIYELISKITIITILIISLSIVLLFGGEIIIRNINDCLLFIIYIISVFSIIPILFFSYKKFFTEIGKIRLIISANGVEIIPTNKKTIFIEYFNISGIHLKETKIKEKQNNNNKQDYIQNTLTLILTLYRPITNLVTNKDIKEIILIENIPNDYLEEATKFTEEIKQILGLQDR